jgi:hypothetical protein
VIKDIKVVKNFLPKNVFSGIKNSLESEEFPWFFSDVVSTSKNKNEEFQYCHVFYKTQGFGIINSTYFDIIYPVIEKIDPKILLRVKANSLTKTDKILNLSTHTDTTDKTIMSAVYYLNSNNGYTLFENGTKIISEENKIVFFPSNYNHCGSTCTDIKRRILLNIVFIPN